MRDVVCASRIEGVLALTLLNYSILLYVCFWPGPVVRQLWALISRLSVVYSRIAQNDLLWVLISRIVCAWRRL